jgi:hypothetical protein
LVANARKQSDLTLTFETMLREMLESLRRAAVTLTFNSRISIGKNPVTAETVCTPWLVSSASPQVPLVPQSAVLLIVNDVMSTTRGSLKGHHPDAVLQDGGYCV